MATWTETAKLTASDGAAGDLFGISVSLSADRALVGAFRDDDNGSDSGSAYVFELMGSSWTETAKLTASDRAANDRFGVSVSLFGDRALVGALAGDDNGNNSGAAYIFVANQPPEAQPDAVATDEDTPLAGDVLADNGSGADTDPDGEPLTVTEVNGVAADVDTQITPASGALRSLNGDGSFDYDPNGQFESLGSGDSTVDSFVYTISDGLASDSATVTVTINGVDDPPVAVDDATTITEDDPATAIDVLANDSDIDGGPMDIVSLTQPANGTAVNNTTDVDYSPDTDYCNDGSPTDDFTYTLNGGSTATVSVAVTCINDAPDFTPGGDVSVAEDSGSFSQSWASASAPGPANESGQSVNFNLSNDNNGLFAMQPAIDSSGTLTFTTAADTTGSATVSVTLMDDGGTTNGGSDTSSTEMFKITVTASADVAVSKDNGSSTSVPGTTTTYTVAASNNGPSDVTGASLTDTFPAALDNCSFTASASGGASGHSASGSGDLNETLDLPEGASVTYTIDCDIAADASGTLANTASVSSGVSDPTTSNNSATDTDTLEPEADVSISKDDGQAMAVPGSSLTYTIVAANSTGPSAADGVSVADPFPADLDCEWTSTASGGATGNTAGPVSGDIAETIDLPVGDMVTYTADCSIAADASGTLSNQATVTASGGVDDSDTANNSASDDTELAMLDFGDAPDSSIDPAFAFPTTLADDGARHGIDDTLFLGAAIDAEGDGQPDATAGGDDNAGATPDDEDGVTFSGTPAVCEDLELTVTASAPGLLNAWLDWNTDGSWQPSEQVAVDVSLSAGANAFVVTVPCDASTAMPVIGRFRLNSAGGLGPAGLADNGEVEDHVFDLLPLDFGDAPDDSVAPSFAYPTTFADNGARHAESSLILGSGWDAEMEGLPSATATGDDTDNTDDEDGVTVPTLVRGNAIDVSVTSAGAGQVDAWIDYNADGDWQDAGEQVLDDASVSAGANTLTVTPPTDAVLGETFARFRLSSAGGLMPTGFAADGEVEDYTVTLANAAPTLSAPTAQTIAEDNATGALAVSVNDNEDMPGDLSLSATSGDTALVPNANITLGGSAGSGSVNAAPADDANGGPVTITLEVTDSDGDSTQSSFDVTVEAVNDAPSFNATSPMAVNEGSGMQMLSSWAAFDPGASNESGQSVQAYTVSNVGDPSLFSAGPAVDPGGTLTYTPAEDANGSSSFDVTVQDDGGTANSGDDTSNPQTFTITVNPVNDAPTFTAGGDVETFEDTAFDQPWASDISPGPPDEAGQSVSFLVTDNTNPGLFSTGPALDPSGQLNFTPTADTTGSAAITVEAEDDGGMANGGDPISDPATFTVDVIAAADLAIDKTSGSFFTPPGGMLTYTLLVTNTGPSDAVDARVEDIPPMRLGDLAWSCTPQSNAVCNAGAMGAIDELVSIPEGDSVIFMLDATLQDTGNDPITNTASVTAPVGLTELATGNNTDSDTDPVGMFASGFESVEPD